ncbi:MAG TPA: prepilin-type N-terminal cleavage/methylation domain-containing protein [Paenibacillaceae bacterium]
MRSTRFRNEKGFTLIELLIVVAIISILAILIIPRISVSLDSAKESADEANAKLLQSAVERYYFDTGRYPTASGTDGGTAGEEINASVLVSQKYIDEEPEDPWKQNRKYRLVGGVVQKLGKP